MITENKNWVFCGGYIDEGICGTAVKNRDRFLKMIEDATLGKIDMVVTKEISRFSRNTVDSIKYTEYLLKQGVIVYFLSDNLNTIQEDSEFRLTIMSSLAQFPRTLSGEARCTKRSTVSPTQVSEIAVNVSNCWFDRPFSIVAPRNSENWPKSL